MKFHFHLFTKEVFNDKVDTLYQCRCGELAHRELAHGYKRTSAQTKAIGEQLISRYKTNNSQITYKEGLRK